MKGDNMTRRKATMLRLDVDLYDKLVAVAKEQDRSVNATLVVALKKYLKKNK